MVAVLVLNYIYKKSAEGPRVEAEYTALTRGYQVLKKNYEDLLLRRESARIGEAADSSADSVQFRIIAQPEEPAFPTGPKRRIFNAIAFVFGLAAGAGFVILLARLHDAVTTADDLAAFGNHLVLGSVSLAQTVVVPEPFFKRHRKFVIGLGALVAVAVLMIVLAPNFSTIPQAVAGKLGAL